MNTLTKVGSLLGTIAFAIMMVGTYHAVTEVQASTNPDSSLTILQDSIVRLDMPSGEICSGWVLKGSNKVMTAAHCFSSGDPKKKDDASAWVTFNNGTKTSYVVTKMGNYNTILRDWAVLEPVKPGTFQVPAGLPVCKDAPYYGQPVVIMGSPLGVDKVMFFGQVANPSFHAHQQEAADLNDLVIFSMQTYKGNSGGPIIDQIS